MKKLLFGLIITGVVGAGALLLTSAPKAEAMTMPPNYNCVCPSYCVSGYKTTCSFTCTGPVCAIRPACSGCNP